MGVNVNEYWVCRCEHDNLCHVELKVCWCCNTLQLEGKEASKEKVQEFFVQRALKAYEWYDQVPPVLYGSHVCKRIWDVMMGLMEEVTP